jgi:uncharacterized YccA/Bax inhibitor family protein
MARLTARYKFYSMFVYIALALYCKSTGLCSNHLLSMLVGSLVGHQLLLRDIGSYAIIFMNVCVVITVVMALQTFAEGFGALWDNTVQLPW